MRESFFSLSEIVRFQICRLEIDVKDSFQTRVCHRWLMLQSISVRE